LGIANITVFNGPPGGGVSNALPFPITKFFGLPLVFKN
jgi:hypothetical protein